MNQYQRGQQINKLILERLTQGHADTQTLANCARCDNQVTRKHLVYMAKIGKVIVVRQGGGLNASIWGIGGTSAADLRPRVRFISPLQIGGKPVQNGFESWLSGLMWEAA